MFVGFPCGSAGKESACIAGDLGSIPGLGTCSGEGNSYPLQYSGLENSMDCVVYGVAKSQTLLSDFHLVLRSLSSGLGIYPFCSLEVKQAQDSADFLSGNI